MSPSVPDNPQHPSLSQPTGLNRAVTLGLGIGVLLMAGGAGAAWYLLDVINHELAPMVAQDLSESLSRPLHLGTVQRYSLTEIEFGPSDIPACFATTPGCAQVDTSAATVKAVKARFNLWEVALTRVLKLDVTLVQPTLSLTQTDDGNWLNLTLTDADADAAWIKTRLQTLRVQAGQIQLNPHGAEPRQLEQVNATVEIINQTQIFRLQGSAQADAGGKATVKGSWHQPKQALTLNADTTQWVAAPWMGFLPPLPFELHQGRLNGRVQVKVRPDQPVQINTDVTITAADVTVPEQAVHLQARQLKGQLQMQADPNHPLKIVGNAQVQDADVSVPEDLILNNDRPRRQQLHQVQGKVKFLGADQSFQFKLGGQLPQGGHLKAQGVASFLSQWLDTQLRAQNVPAPLLDRAYKLPIAIQSGQVDANLKLKLRQRQQPHLNGTAVIKNVDAQIVGLPQPFYQTQGRLRFRGLTTKLEQVQARYGQVPLEGNGWIDPDRGFNLTADTRWVEANTALQTLQVTGLPFPVAGEVQAQTLRVTGAIEQPQLTGTIVGRGQLQLDRVPFQQLQAQFKLETSKQPVLHISQIQAQPVVGGTITGQARYDLQPQDQLTATFDIEDVPGNGLAQLYGANPPFTPGATHGPSPTIRPPPVM